MEALPLLEVELRLMVPDLVWVPDLLAPAPILGQPSAKGAEGEEQRSLAVRPGSTQGLAAMWASWVQTLLSASGRVAKLDAAEGGRACSKIRLCARGMQEAVRAAARAAVVQEQV